MKLQPTERFTRIAGRAEWTLHYRFTFSIEGDIYHLLRVGTHDLMK